MKISQIFIPHCLFSELLSVVQLKVTSILNLVSKYSQIYKGMFNK